MTPLDRTHEVRTTEVRTTEESSQNIWHEATKKTDEPNCDVGTETIQGEDINS